MSAWLLLTRPKKYTGFHCCNRDNAELKPTVPTRVHRDIIHSQCKKSDLATSVDPIVSELAALDCGK